MARIALIAGLAVLGAFMPFAAPGLFAAASTWTGAILAGAAIGASAGSILGSVLFPPNNPNNPPLNDLQVMSSAPGSVIPYGFGAYRIAGQVIWAEQLEEVTGQTYPAGGSAGQTTSNAYQYFATCAISFGYGPGTITRIWADTKLVFDSTGKGPISLGVGVNDSNGNQVTEPFKPLIYPGTMTQTPDPTIQSIEGIESTPAFHGQIYMVLNKFPLADFANRLPNFRAEISTNSEQDYVTDLFGSVATAGEYSQAIGVPSYVYFDQTNRYAYVIDQYGQTIQMISADVNVGVDLDPWMPETSYVIGDEVLDNNGNVELCIRTHTSGDEPFSGPNAIGWATGFGEYSQTGDLNTWQNLGPGPTAVPIVAQGQLILPNSNNQQSVNLPGAFGVNTAGKIWGCGLITSGSNVGYCMICYAIPTTLNNGPYGGIVNPVDFTAVTIVAIPPTWGSVISFVPFKDSNGNDNLVCLTQNGSGLVVLSTGGPITNIQSPGSSGAQPASWVAQGTWKTSAQTAGSPVITLGDGLSSIPCADPATGNVYLVSYDSSNNTYINICNFSNGSIVVNAVLTVPTTWRETGSEHGVALFWCADDNTLIMTTTAGSARAHVVKISTTGQILGYLHNIVDSSDGVMSACAKGYNCLVPTGGTAASASDLAQGPGGPTSDAKPVPPPNPPPNPGQPGGGTGSTSIDGVLKLPDGTASENMVYIECLGMIILKSVPLVSWLPALINSSMTDMAFDPTTDSAMTICNGGYAGTSQRIYFDKQAVSETPLSTVLQTFWNATGAAPALLDTSQVENISVRGYPITQISSPKGLIQPLCLAYWFDLVESDNLLVAVPRGQPVTTIISEPDLGTFEDGHEVQPTFVQENSLPLIVNLNYSDPALNYQQAKQMFQRNARVKNTKNRTNVSVPLTLTSDEAAEIAAQMLLTAWAEKNHFDFKLWKASYLVLDPSDVVQFWYNGNPYQGRILRINTGQNFVLEITAVSEDPRQYLATGGPTKIVGFQNGGIVPVVQTVLFVLDIPYISDTDANNDTTGFYFGVSPTGGTNWPGAILYLSTDNSNFADEAQSAVECYYGSVVAATPAPAHLFSWDRVTQITVKPAANLDLPPLSSIGQSQVFGGTNWFYMGGEIMAFATATLNDDGTYTLSQLLRGLRGTEGWCGSHIPNETFILLTNDVTHEQLPSKDVGESLYFRGVTSGLPVANSTSQKITMQGNDLKPYAPAQFVGNVDEFNNIDMSWVRRTRVGGGWIDGTGVVPVSEETESYNLYIYGNVSLLDDIGIGAGTSTAMSTETVQTSQPNDFCVSAMCDANPNSRTITPGAGWTADENGFVSYSGDPSDSFYFLSQSQIAANPSTVVQGTATSNEADDWAMAMVCFHAASGQKPVVLQTAYGDNSGTGSPTTSASATLSNPTLPNSVLVVSFNTFGASVTVSDSQGNVYQVPAQAVNSGDNSANISIAYAIVLAPGSTEVTVTVGSAVPLALFVYEVSNLQVTTSSFLVRSVLNLPSPEYQYTTAAQIFDFGTTQPSVYATVYQVSAKVGQGFPTTNPTCGAGNVVL